jgi:predicted N-acetyltransferase YhbS
MNSQPMPPLIIRDWQPADDIAAITQLLHAAYAGLAESGLRFLASHQDEAMTHRRLESGRAFIAAIDNRIVSTITLYGPDPNSRCEVYRRPGTFHLGQLAVHPDAQGLWIGAR